MEQKCSVHNVITEKVVLTMESPPEIWVWRFRSKQPVVRHNRGPTIVRITTMPEILVSFEQLNNVCLLSP